VDQIASGTATTDGFYLRGRTPTTVWACSADGRRGLGNEENARCDDVLIELLVDEDVAGHAVIALGKLKDQRAREACCAPNHPKLG